MPPLPPPPGQDGPGPDLPPRPDLSIVVPARNEEGNIGALVSEIGDAMGPTGLRFEVIIVDDHSTDDTRGAIARMMPGHPWLRGLSLRRTDGPRAGGGQSAAFCAGIRASRGRLIASLDADLQNDPADIPRMLVLMDSSGADMVQGDRSSARKDGAARKLGAQVGRLARRTLLGDTIRDTGCSLRIMKRETALDLPLELAGMHRFIPGIARSLGYRVVEVPVNHRARRSGRTKYGLGIGQRAIPGLLDCFAVRYMRGRRRCTTCDEVVP